MKMKQFGGMLAVILTAVAALVPGGAKAVATSFTRKVRGNRGVRARTLLRLTAGLAVMVPFAALLHGPSPALAQVSPLGAAEDFAVLGGSAVTCTGSAVDGNVGGGLGGAVTQTNCTISGTVHVGDTVAQRAHDDFLLAYAALGLVQCDVNLTGQPLGGQSLTPGVYCFDAAVTETGGVLTLDGSSTDTWIFKVGTSGTGALTGTNFSVVRPGGQTCNNNVFWRTAGVATLTDSVFLGSILAGTSITVTSGSLDGQALAKAAATLTGASVCGPSPQPPVGGSVTGGGAVAVAGAGAGSFPAATTFAAVTLSGVEFGLGVFVAADGSASGQFHAVLLGASLLGQPRQIVVEGKAGTGGVGADGRATVGGTAAIDLGDGTPPLPGVPFTVTVSPLGLLSLLLDGTALPEATLSAGGIAID